MSKSFPIRTRSTKKPTSQLTESFVAVASPQPPQFPPKDKLYFDLINSSFNNEKNIVNSHCVGDILIKENLEKIKEILNTKEIFIARGPIKYRSSDISLSFYRDILINSYSISDFSDTSIKRIKQQKTAMFGYSSSFDGTINHLKTQIVDGLNKRSIEYLFISYRNIFYNEVYHILIAKNFKDYADLIRYYKKLLKFISTEKSDIKVVLPGNMLQEIMSSSIDFMNKKSAMEDLGGNIQTGLIFSGKPGNGKSLTCKFLMQAAARKNKEISRYTNADILSAASTGRLSDLMNREGIQIYDDIDISFFNRNNGGRSEIATSMLSAMDGVNDKFSCVRIFSTNEMISDIDPAFLRPGRIDRIFKFELPNKEMRMAYLESWHKDVLSKIDNKESVLEKTDGFSFAEMNLIRQIIIRNIISKTDYSMDYIMNQISQERPSLLGKKNAVGFRPN